MSGPFGSSQWMYASDRFYDHPINQSLRFSSVDGGFGEITYGSAGNRRTWSWSAWIKRSLITQSSRQRIWATQDGSGIEENIRFETDDQIRWICHNSDGSDHDHDVTTSAVFRDTSAWFHLLIVKDTTESTDSDRVKIYINGSLQSFEGSPNHPSSNFEGHINKGQNHHIGSHVNDNSENFDGYMAEVHFIDGTAVSPSVLGETKAGIWIPKKYTGSHGTNGYHFTFADTSSNNALFNDDSANSNNFTSVGIVAGHDFMKDSPTNNFATLKTHGSPSSATFNQGNLEFTSGTGDSARNLDRQCISTILIPTSGKWYCEVLPLATTATFIGITAHQEGRIDHAANNTRYAYFYPVGDGGSNGQIYIRTGASESIQNYGAPTGTGDIIGVFVDMDQSTPRLYFSKNGQWASGSNFNQSNPTDFVELGDSFFTTDSDSGQGAFGAARSGGSTSIGPVFNFGQERGAFRGQKGAGSETDSNGNGLFKYAVPSGGLALCTANLPSPGIDPEEGESPAEYFNTVLYSGTGSSASVTGVGFAPDWVWIKERSSTSGHSLHDTVRGTNKRLDSSATSSESASGVTAFGTDGFTQDGGGATGESGQTYVSWNWLAGGSASSNSDGSITSSVSASQESGFSIVTYTGNSTAGATVGHGLGKKPTMIIVKNRDDGAQDWPVLHGSIGATGQMVLSSNALNNTNSVYWNNTEPTSSVFSLGTANNTNKASNSHVAYCFADIEGYQKIGSYKGNGNADGPVIITGFRPAWVMYKTITSTANHWAIRDNKRDPHNEVLLALYANLSNGDDTGGDAIAIDMLSNGFKPRRTNSQVNENGTEYLYLAIAEQPFKFANAR